MNDPAPSREQRLAAKLRENLRRRKVQAREQSQVQSQVGQDDPAPALPKSPPSV